MQKFGREEKHRLEQKKNVRKRKLLEEQSLLRKNIFYWERENFEKKGVSIWNKQI